MSTYRIKCTGLTPLLMKSNNVDWEDEMSLWQANNKKPKGAAKKTKPAKGAEVEEPEEESEEIVPASKAGDDRTPAFRWIGCLWNDDTHVGIAHDALTKALMRGGAGVELKGKTSFRSLAVSGMRVEEKCPTLIVRGKPLVMADIRSLMNQPLFPEHKKAVAGMGFSLDVRRATVGMSQHVRVRPRFDAWSFEYTIEVWSPLITDEKLKAIVGLATEQGLGDWRPSAPKSPGVYGRYEAKVKKV